MSKIRKAITAFVAGFMTALAGAYAQDASTNWKAAIGIAVVGGTVAAVAVWAVPNETPSNGVTGTYDNR